MHYLLAIRVARSQIEEYTGERWDGSEIDDVYALVRDYDGLSRTLTQEKFPGDLLSYLAFLRHHGFPSPLLDWTRSPYIAAHFAFREVPIDAEYVAIFAYDERPKRIKVSGNDLVYIHRFGANFRTHRRHYLQQSAYTICLKFDMGTWIFEEHQAASENGPADQDIITKILLPVTEKQKVLNLLADFNLTDFSLFNDTESLVRTLAAKHIG